MADRIEPLDTILDEDARWKQAKAKAFQPRKSDHWLMTATKKAINARAAMDVLKWSLIFAACFIAGCLLIPVVLP